MNRSPTSILFAACLALLVSGALPAQIPGTGPVTLGKLEAPAEATAGEAFQIKVPVQIANPYHIYGLTKMSEEWITRLQFKSEGYEVSVDGDIEAVPAPQLKSDGVMTYEYWEGGVTFTVPIVVKGAAGDAVLEVTVDYMACTWDNCLAPAKLTGQAKLSVVAGEPEEKEETSADKVAVVHAKGPESITVGEPFEVKLKLAIEEPWHIYGLKQVDVETPTAIKIVRGQGYQIVGEIKPDREPVHFKDETIAFDYWEREIEFTIPMKLNPGAGRPAGRAVKPAVELEVSFMACTHEECLFDDSHKVAIGDVSAALPVEEGEQPPTTSGTKPTTTKSVVQARFDADDVQPNRVFDLSIALPEGAVSSGTRLEPKSLLFSNSALKPEGKGRVVSGKDGLAAVFPVRVSATNAKEGDLGFGGYLKLPNKTVEFAGSVTVTNPLWGFLLIAAGAALLALLTPCVFPMIPITVSFFTKQAETSKKSPVSMGLLYAAGIIISFTAIGALFTVFLGPAGASEFALSWITQGLIGLLFVVFALSLFGLFEIQLPAGFMNMVGKAQGRGGSMGVWLLGMLFAVTTFTCTAPFIGGLLAGAATSGDYLRPVLGMLVFSTVLAIPFFFLSLFPSRLKKLPKSGGWLNSVKVCMGFIELAAALKFFGGMDMALGGEEGAFGMFTRGFIIAAWVAIFAAMAFYLFGMFRLPHDSPSDGKIGVMPLIFGLLSFTFAIYLTRGLDGSELNGDIDAYLPPETEYRRPEFKRQQVIDGILSSVGTVSVGGEAQVKGRTGLANKFKDQYAEALAEARRLDVPLFIDFTGPG